VARGLATNRGNTGHDIGSGDRPRADCSRTYRRQSRSIRLDRPKPRYSGDRIRIRHFRDNHAKPFPLWEFRQAVCEPVHREGLWERLEIGNLSPESLVRMTKPL